MSSNAPQPLAVDVPRSTAPTLDHERLEVYHHALQFHALASTLVPKRGLRAVRDQLERASLGVVLCIAEGAGRTAGPDKRRSYEMARGSATESAAVLDVLRIRGLLDAEAHRQGRLLVMRLVQMLSRLCGPPR
jgi:four helix bundle protein